MQPWYTDGSTTRRIEEARLDPFEALGLRGTNRAEIGVVDTFGGFDHAFVPHQQHILALITQCCDMGLSLVPEILVQ